MLVLNCGADCLRHSFYCACLCMPASMHCRGCAFYGLFCADIGQLPGRREFGTRRRARPPSCDSISVCYIHERLLVDRSIIGVCNGLLSNLALDGPQFPLMNIWLHTVSSAPLAVEHTTRSAHKASIASAKRVSRIWAASKSQLTPRWCCCTCDIDIACMRRSKLPMLCAILLASGWGSESPWLASQLSQGDGDSGRPKSNGGGMCSTEK